MRSFPVESVLLSRGHDARCEAIRVCVKGVWCSESAAGSSRLHSMPLTRLVEGVEQLLLVASWPMTDQGLRDLFMSSNPGHPRSTQSLLPSTSSDMRDTFSWRSFRVDVSSRNCSWSHGHSFLVLPIVCSCAPCPTGWKRRSDRLRAEGAALRSLHSQVQPA